MTTRNRWGSVTHLAFATCLLLGCSKSGSSGNPKTSGPPDPGIPTVPGEPDTSVQTALPAVPALINVSAITTGDSTLIKYDPVDGAKDYRVYVLPADEDITALDDGHVTVQNAIYRCAGDRQTPPLLPDDAPSITERTNYYDKFRSKVDGSDVEGYKRTLNEATLGYVYTTPGDGRIPVFSMGDPAGTADNQCPGQAWGASRSKRFVAGQEAHDKLLAERWRDDGISFYVPASGSDGTVNVLTNSSEWTRLYFTEGSAEAGSRKNAEPAFSVLTGAGGADVKPLMRVFYANPCGIQHDELVAGQARFERARVQGDKLPMFEMTWSGITEETTLVVEALDVGCPYPGFLGPKDTEAVTSQGIKYDAHATLASLQGASTTGEVFINGQHEAANKPRPIARSFIKVKPSPVPDMDWFTGFDAADDMGAFTASWCDDGVDCTDTFRENSANWDLTFESADHYSFGKELGQLWVSMADVGADVGAKLRMTPSLKGKITADSFLHVTMQVDSFTTGRRYPQILISDQQAPVQERIPKGRTYIVQSFGTWPPTYEFQVCDNRDWDVSFQCPRFDFQRTLDPNDSDKIKSLNPSPDVGEHMGIDRPTQFDVYVSSKRAYLLLDGLPFGCANLPATGMDSKGVALNPQGPTGDVTVTFGDVLYHSGVDDGTFSFHLNHLQVESRRHFDNLGFKSGTAAPAWDETRFPCTSRVQ